MYNLSLIAKSALLSASSQLGPVLAVVVAIVIAGIAVIVVEINKS